jgi:hypothetical protein
MEFWASLRMNDTHYKDQVFNPWLDQFYYDNLNNRIARPNGRINTEFDYRKTVVRDYYLGLIRDAVERYEVDGIEMDFTRNCRFFPRDFPEECAPVMTQFVREVRRLLDQWGKKRGRRLVLAATVPHSLCGCRKEGLDIPTWARLELIDVLCLSTPFLARFDHDVHDTKLKLPGVQVYAGCDRNVDFGSDGASRVVPKQTYRAMAMNYLRQGAQGTYLYNVMSWTMNYAKATEAVKRDGGQGETGDVPIDYDRNLMNEVGSIETLEGLDKLYLVSHGEERDLLPVNVCGGEEASVALRLGDDIAAAEHRIAEIWLQVISSDCEDYGNWTVKLNNVDLSRQYAFVPYADEPDDVLLFPEPARRGELPPPNRVRRHPVRPIDLLTGLNHIAIKSYGDPLTVVGVELAIRYRA